MSTRVRALPFDALTRHELYAILHLRDLVFVVGQGITAVPEVDGLDPECVHMMLEDEHGRLLGTARCFADRTPVSVGRVAIHPDHQRRGLGTVLMRAVQEWLDGRDAELHAQAHLEDWYASLGWVRDGASFLEARIPHVTMRWSGTSAHA
ncbi:MAG: GNAT family N-acetyltransferase [Deltaproteobacteria bacterium]|nr:MAG: GNAT family N-acetyltransferase [Deltaproteobacteria bacterium]